MQKETPCALLETTQTHGCSSEIFFTYQAKLLGRNGAIFGKLTMIKKKILKKDVPATFLLECLTWVVAMGRKYHDSQLEQPQCLEKIRCWPNRRQNVTLFPSLLTWLKVLLHQ